MSAGVSSFLFFLSFFLFFSTLPSPPPNTSPLSPHPHQQVIWFIRSICVLLCLCLLLLGGRWGPIWHCLARNEMDIFCMFFWEKSEEEEEGWASAPCLLAPEKKMPSPGAAALGSLCVTVSMWLFCFSHFFFTFSFFSQQPNEYLGSEIFFSSLPSLDAFRLYVRESRRTSTPARSFFSLFAVSHIVCICNFWCTTAVRFAENWPKTHMTN